MKSVFPYDSVELSPNGREVVILDQTQLPLKEQFLHLDTAEQVFYAITRLKVRGAPAIGTVTISWRMLCYCFSRQSTELCSACNLCFDFCRW